MNEQVNEVVANQRVDEAQATPRGAPEKLDNIERVVGSPGGSKDLRPVEAKEGEEVFSEKGVVL